MTSQLLRGSESHDMMTYEVVVHELEADMMQHVFIFTENSYGRSESSHSAEVHTQSMNS